MLVLSRKMKQSIRIGADVVVTIVAVKGNRVTIGIEAPRCIEVIRGELDQDDDHALSMSTESNAANLEASNSLSSGLVLVAD